MQDTSASDESESLFELAIKGDANALDRLFAPCLPQLKRTAARLLGNNYCEDALQDGLLSALRYLNKFEGRAQFSTWLHIIVVNAAKATLRKQRREPITLSLDELLPEQENVRFSDTLPHPQQSLEEDYAQLEHSQILAAVLQALPPTSRSVIWLCDVEGLCQKQAAERLGLSLSAVKARHFRANRLILRAAKESFHQEDSPAKTCQSTESSVASPRSPKPKQARVSIGQPETQKAWGSLVP